jgi:hypothetical protein
MAQRRNLMSLSHFTHYEPSNKRWHAVYQMAGDTGLSSVGSASTQASAALMAQQANAAQEAQERAALAAAIHPADRHIPAGFYSDKDPE